MTTPAESPYLPGNPYIRMMELSGEHMPPEVGAVYATLALAYEQRTATLLAVTNKQYLPGANDQVKQRLGWPEGVEPPTPRWEPEDRIEAATKQISATLLQHLEPITYAEGNPTREDVALDGEANTRTLAEYIVTDLLEKELW